MLPAEAGAKMSFRLVPNQDPKKVYEGLKKRIAELVPPGIEFNLIDMHGAPGRCRAAGKPVYGASGSRRRTRLWNSDPYSSARAVPFPVVGSFKELLGIDTLLLGWGQDDDNPHSPDEKFSLEDFQRGVKSSAHLWQELSTVSG